MSHPTVTELVQQHRDRTGDSYQTMSFRSRCEIGREVAAAYIQKIGAGQIRAMPHDLPGTINGLACALNTSPRQVYLAYGTQLGLELDRSAFADQLPATVDDLPAHVQDGLLGLIRALVRGEVAEAPRTPADSVPDIDADSMTTRGIHPLGSSNRTSRTKSDRK